MYFLKVSEKKSADDDEVVAMDGRWDWGDKEVAREVEAVEGGNGV